jgi:hypothetical protein
MNAVVMSESPSTSAALLSLAPLPRRPVDVDVLALRAGRIAFGVGFLVGPTVTMLLHFAGVVTAIHVLPYLLAAWVAGLLAYAVVPVVARAWLAWLARDGAQGGRAGDALLRWSLISPGVVLALFAPLSLHAPIALLIKGNDALDGWAAMSAFAVGPAHLVLAGLVALRTWRLVDGDEPMSTRRIYWIVVAASCVPGLMWLAIPPIVTAITGLAITPLLGRMAAIVDEERRRLDA